MYSIGIEASQQLTFILPWHFSTTIAVYIEDCEGRWLSGCHSSVAEYWQHKPGVLGSIPGDFRPFHFPLFLSQIHLISLYPVTKQRRKKIEYLKFFMMKLIQQFKLLN